MPDPIHCPHLPSAGPVYRVQVVQAVSSRDAPVRRYLVCARCYATIAAVLEQGAPAPTAAPKRPAWTVTRSAVERFVHLLRDSRRDPVTADPADERAFAEWRLVELMPTATYRATDTQGRELWRSPPSAFGLRWVVQHDRVLWVGAGRPPQSVWTPEESR